jgi:hypothetical protein
MTPRFAPTAPAPSNSGIADPGRLLGKNGGRKNGGRSQLIDSVVPKTVIDLLGEDPLASMVTVSLNVELPPLPPPQNTLAQRPPLVAYLMWGTDGATNNAEVDVIRGQTIQVPASQLIVQVGLDVLPAILDPLPRAAAAQVSGSVGYLPTGAGPARRTRYGFLMPFGTGGGADTMTVDIPPFARSVQALPQFAIGAPFRVLQLGPSGIVLGELNTIDPNARMVFGALATRVSVQNQSATPTVCALSFELAL